MIIFHMVKESEWKNFIHSEFYGGKSLKTDGFLHCCSFDQILHVANNNLRSIDEKLLILCINTEYLSSELKWEKNFKNGMVFPHIYGPINKESVINTIEFKKEQSGNFSIPKELYNYQNIEKSCGAIVIHKFENEYKALLIGFTHANKLNWGFPKGHVENNESEHETAKREIKEETGLEVEFIGNFREHTYFSCKKGVTQEVVYFGAKSHSEKVTCQKGEVDKYIWCNFEDVGHYLTFECDRNIFKNFAKFFNK